MTKSILALLQLITLLLSLTSTSTALPPDHAVGTPSSLLPPCLVLVVGTLLVQATDAAGAVSDTAGLICPVLIFSWQDDSCLRLDFSPIRLRIVFLFEANDLRPSTTHPQITSQSWGCLEMPQTDKSSKPTDSLHSSIILIKVWLKIATNALVFYSSICICTYMYTDICMHVYKFMCVERGT